MKRAAIFLLSLTLFLSGCGNAKWTSIYRTFDGSDSVVIDAKQRAILRSQAKNEDNRLSYVCAEPSPDALSAVSSSLATSGSFSGAQPNPKIEAAFASALQEAAMQLRRGRTVQLLRDGLYRACEGYMNGALSWEDYKKLAQKYADATVTLMAIEQITPGDQSPPVNVSPGSSNANGFNSSSATSEGSSEKPSTGDKVGRKDTPVDGQPSEENLDAGSNKSDRSSLAGKGPETKDDKANSSNGETQKRHVSATASSQTLSVSGPQTSVTSTVAVPIEVANVVGALVSQYLKAASQNTCIDTFSSPFKPVGENTSSSAPISDFRRHLEEKEYLRIEALRSYCDEIFKVETRKTTRSSDFP